MDKTIKEKFDKKHPVVVDLVKKFNTQFIQFLKKIAKICPESVVANHLNLILKSLSLNQYKAIDIYVVHVLKHKTEIDNYNAQFFLGDSAYEEFKSNKLMMDIVNSLKLEWSMLDEKQKMEMFHDMQLQCLFSLDYYNKVYS